MILPRSLPSGFEAAGTPPVAFEPTSTSPSSSYTMSKDTSKTDGFLNFLKTTLLPILIALVLYLFLFHFLLPLYRKHRARYSQYLPLSSTSTLTSRLPTSLRPSSLRTHFTDTLLRIFLPSTYALRRAQRTHRHNTQRRNSTSSTISSSSHILTDESGEAMIGFDYSNTTGSIEDQNRRRRDAMERQVARGLQAAREMGMGATGGPITANNSSQTPIPPERRLSRELEEVFRDDSDDDNDEDDEDGPNAVTVGRRSMSISR